MQNAKVVEVIVTELLEGRSSIGSIIAHFNELVLKAQG